MKNYNRKEIDNDGTVHYYLDNEIHRTDGPAIEYSNGDKQWFKNDQLHRTDGPAIEFFDDTKEWWQNDQLHRIDGPAVEYASYKEWHYYGKKN